MSGGRVYERFATSAWPIAQLLAKWSRNCTARLHFKAACSLLKG